MISNLINGQDVSGNWLMIRDGNYYGKDILAKFKDDQILHFEMTENSANGVLEKVFIKAEKFSKTKLKSVNTNRFRLYEMGKTLTVISESETISKDTEFSTDYERIEPTKTDLSKAEIELSEFVAKWNNENIEIIFNKITDSPALQEAMKRLNQEGSKKILEIYKGTYFISIYNNKKRQALIPIRYIDKEKIILYGFPKEPYEIIGNSGDKLQLV